jgi:hypothetical protein
MKSAKFSINSSFNIAAAFVESISSFHPLAEAFNRTTNPFYALVALFLSPFCYYL